MPKLIQPLKGLGGLPKLKGLTKAKWRRGPGRPKPITLEPEVPGEKVDPLEAAAAQGVMGSLPERIIRKWLEGSGYLYQVQVGEGGGARQLGGMTLDFVVYGIAAFPVALRVQGTYWHRLGERTALDDEQAGRLRLRGYIVVDLSEQDIYRAVLGHRLDRYVKSRITA